MKKTLYLGLIAMIAGGLSMASAAQEQETAARGPQQQQAQQQPPGGRGGRGGGGAAANEAAARASTNEEWSVTQHTIHIGGQTIPYTASAGTTLLRNDAGEPIGLMYSVAYVRSDVTDKSKRPIAFLYNGGPGSATMWLHMGAFGPRRVVTTDGEFTAPAPYKLTDNTESLLDKTDLVFIDAMGTGYSHLVGVGRTQDFDGIDEDMRSFGQFIDIYISRNDRWNSPKFLIGESYGTFRSAVVGNYLQNAYTMHLNGIVLMSSVLDLSTITFGAADDRVYVYYLPSYAAVAWYHKALKNRPANLPEFIQEARDYAKGEYAAALFKGDKITPAEKKAVADKLSYFTGLSEDYLMKANLRVTLNQFNVELLRGRDLTVGRIDARFTGYTRDLLAEGSQGDPEGPAVGGAFTAMLNQYNRDELGLKGPAWDNMEYHNSSGGGGWNYTRTMGGRGGGGGGGGFPGAPNVGPDLASAMITNPKLLVEVENGYFDFATPFFATEFTMSHLGLPDALQKNVGLKYYEAGHMMYLHDASRVELHNNIAALIDRATK
jgi:carboxypeptidase C (cathepsin A)